MPEQVICDLCSQVLQPSAHYVVRIDIFADPAVPGIDLDDLHAPDLDQTFAELMEQMKNMSLDELQDSVHRRVEYRLCPACHKSYMANPLGKPRGQNSGVN